MNDQRYSLILVLVLFLIEKNCGKVIENLDDDYCAILINGGLAEPQPLLLCPKKGQNDFVYPTNTGSLYLVAMYGESLRIACPGSKLNLDTYESYNDTIVTCMGDNYFLIENTDIEETFDRLSCEKYPNYVARRTDVPCGNGVVLEIGFPLQTSRKRQEFYRVIDVCHDEDLGHTIYAHAKIFAVIDSAQKSFPRTSFRKGNFFQGIEINKLYTRDVQRETIGRILNSKKLGFEYISDKGSYFLARGHLVAKSDFIYGSQQRATFFYINVVPMWQSINGGNWKIMEANVRSYAIDKELDLDVWTGSLGVLKLEDNRGIMREIYLHAEEDRHAVPVPKILFKVVYSESTQSGIVFLTANNPYLDKLTKEYRICKDICYKISYLTWKPKDGERGLSYCCEIEDFRKAFPNIPCFKTTRLLL